MKKGLGMAGLNFVGNAAYAEEATEADKDLVQVAQYELFHGSLPSVLRWLKQGGCFPI